MKKTLFTVTLILFCLSIIYLKKKTSWSSRDSKNASSLKFALPTKVVKTFSFGFDSFLASLIWVDLLQKAEHHPLKNSEKSWESIQLLTLVDLDPKFLHAYSFGTGYLSVLRRDKQGGKIFLEKWVKNQPLNWKAQFSLAMHYHNETNDLELAANHILKASLLPNAPDWLSSAGIGFLSKTGQEENALQTALEFYPLIQSSESKLLVFKRIRNLHISLEKKRLMTGLNHYRLKYKREPKNIKQITLIANPNRQIANLNTSLMPEEIKTLLSTTFSFEYNKNEKTIILIGADNGI